MGSLASDPVIIQMNSAAEESSSLNVRLAGLRIILGTAVFGRASLAADAMAAVLKQCRWRPHEHHSRLRVPCASNQHSSMTGRTVRVSPAMTIQVACEMILADLGDKCTSFWVDKSRAGRGVAFVILDRLAIQRDSDAKTGISAHLHDLLLIDLRSMKQQYRAILQSRDEHAESSAPMMKVALLPNGAGAVLLLVQLMSGLLWSILMACLCYLRGAYVILANPSLLRASLAVHPNR